MIDAAFALARTYLQQKRVVRLEEAVGIVVAHKGTEMASLDG